MNKKTIITALLVLVCVAGQAQTFTHVVEDSIDFVITGTTTSSHDSVAMFPCAPHGKTVKFPIVGGKFKVTGRQPRHTFIQIGDNAENDLRFIVEETPTNINLVTGEVSGSELQQRFIRCQMRERDIDRVAEPWWDSLGDDEKDRIIDMRMGRLSDVTEKDSANFMKYEDFMGDRNALVRQNIRENKDNIIPAWYLYTDNDKLNYEEMHEFIREDAAYAHHPAMERPWKVYWGMLQQMNITGKPAPDFEAEAPDGTMHHLSEYTGHGQYVLIDFWASWCGPCIGSFPFMKELYVAYKDRGLVFLGVSCDKNRDAWLKALEKHQLPWTALRSPSSKGDACELYGITGIPAVILITPDGKVLSTDLEGEKLKAKLEEIFTDK
ncbi:MAG: TlpA family protein disulfide reductase [Prevotella sp.]|nr:TlpA family protein disulfide reductase [Prevotella sp.]